MTWKSSILDELKGYWQPVRSAILATAGLVLVILASNIDWPIFEIISPIFPCTKLSIKWSRQTGNTSSRVSYLSSCRFLLTWPILYRVKWTVKTYKLILVCGLLVIVSGEVQLGSYDVAIVDIIEANVDRLQSEWQWLADLTGRRPRPAVAHPLGDVTPHRPSTRATRLKHTYTQSHEGMARLSCVFDWHTEDRHTLTSHTEKRQPATTRKHTSLKTLESKMRLV